ncbi:MAG TPA: hypothetical protein VFA86_02435 [Gammaproteobacteria bacterium]|nr:hypothetical protein [Gammaproteobacteria bacterium]
MEEIRGSRALHRLEDNLDASVALVGRARRQVCLLCPALDPLLYGREEFISAVRGFLLTSTRAGLRVLVHDGQAPMRRGHPLVPVLRRFSSQAECRRVAGDFREQTDSVLLVDGRMLVHRPDAAGYEGHVDADPRRARTAQARFDEIWEHSEPDRELRRLYI